MRNKFRLMIFGLLSLLLLSIFLGIIKGSVRIPFSELLLKENREILDLRLLRVFVAIIAGSGLAVSGVALQAILRNSLAEPYLLGTSSGAGLGAVAGVLIGLSVSFLPLTAFVGAIASVILVYNISRQNNKLTEQSLILSGVIVSVALSAIIVFLISILSNQYMHGLTWWLWGSLQVYNPKLILAVALIVFFGIAVIYLFSQDLNAISAGEEEAVHLGIDIETVKKIIIVVTSLITASIVCICGIIGFVGLIVPHMIRLIVGPNHKSLIPATCFAAAIFMVLCDVLSRTIMPPIEIPIGVITAIIGAPTFVFLLKRSQRIK